MQQKRSVSPFAPEPPAVQLTRPVRINFLRQANGRHNVAGSRQKRRHILCRAERVGCKGRRVACCAPSRPFKMDDSPSRSTCTNSFYDASVREHRDRADGGGESRERNLRHAFQG